VYANAAGDKNHLDGKTKKLDESDGEDLADQRGQSAHDFLSYDP
jgi:hypothetical protein